MRHVYLHSEDLDGWLAPPNQPLQPVYSECFRRLNGLHQEAGTDQHELRIVLNSGKSVAYLEEQARTFGAEHVIASCGGALHEVGGRTHWFTGAHPDFRTLRCLLGITSQGAGVAPVRCEGYAAEVAIEEGKCVDAGDVVLTLFCDPKSVNHRWQFHAADEPRKLYDLLRRLIEQYSLSLSVLEPHADGALDIVPLVDGRPLGKWTLPLLAQRMFPDCSLHLTHGGDGSGDLSAMSAPGVLPLSALCCPATRREAGQRGVLTHRDPVLEVGVLDCYAQLAARGFYGPLSQYVSEIVRDYL